MTSDDWVRVGILFFMGIMSAMAVGLYGGKRDE